MEEGELLMDGRSDPTPPTRRRNLRSGVSYPTRNTGVNLSRHYHESTRHCESTVFGDFGTSELVIPELPIHPETYVDTAKANIHDTHAQLLRGLYPNAARNETPLTVGEHCLGVCYKNLMKADTRRELDESV